jgi:hypothetical protein
MSIDTASTDQEGNETYPLLYSLQPTEAQSILINKQSESSNGFCRRSLIYQDHPSLDLRFAHPYVSHCQ